MTPPEAKYAMVLELPCICEPAWVRTCVIPLAHHHPPIHEPIHLSIHLSIHPSTHPTHPQPCDRIWASVTVVFWSAPLHSVSALVTILRGSVGVARARDRGRPSGTKKCRYQSPNDDGLGSVALAAPQQAHEDAGDAVTSHQCLGVQRRQLQKRICAIPMVSRNDRPTDPTPQRSRPRTCPANPKRDACRMLVLTPSSATTRQVTVNDVACQHDNGSAKRPTGRVAPKPHWPEFFRPRGAQRRSMRSSSGWW